jgi:kelch-like protein 10
MLVPRKEHATVYLDGNVYAIGGYDGVSKTMLSSCERYNFETDEWKIVEQLTRQKCAFAATTVNN